MFTLRNFVLPPYHFVGRGLLRASNVAAATPSTTPRRWNRPTSAVAATEREEGTKKEIKLSVVNPGSAADLPPVTATASRAGLTLWVGALFNLVANS